MENTFNLKNITLYIKQLILLLIVVLCCSSCKTNNSETTDKPIENKEVAKEKKESASLEVSSIEDAKKYAVGTWQFTKTGAPFWEKYEINADGNFIYFLAEPRDGKWTKGPEGKWTVETDRYNDTGKKYYYIEAKFNSDKNLVDKHDIMVFKFIDMVARKDLSVLIKTTRNPWD